MPQKNVSATNDLHARHCLPCEGGIEPLDERSRNELLKNLPGWTIEQGKCLTKTYKFQDFSEALAEVNRIGALAEEENHHPDLHLSWGKVEVRLSTHSIGGLSENDFIMAAKIDSAYSPGGEEQTH